MGDVQVGRERAAGSYTAEWQRLLERPGHLIHRIVEIADLIDSGLPFEPGDLMGKAHPLIPLGTLSFW